ncbi:MAG TPA: hypothetical protein DER07_01710 [Armatimonadetes bacterium]|nr:hypothetical protein [Armatimonadota bacterium]MCA1995973.1 hypothetical protein [Armatimonadota bacterium]HCD99740.1 hypothetical protein [Armatimonadota bacterium]
MKAARLLLLLFASLPMACGSMQEEAAKDRLQSQVRSVDAAAGSQTVTRGEAAKALSEAERVLSEVLRIPRPGNHPLQSGDAGQPLRRTEAILALKRLFDMASPRFCFTPRFVAYEASRLTVPPGDPSRAALEELIRWQCVAKLGPVAAGERTTLTVDEFGDALGFCLARLADLTHMPSTRWSPYLMDDEDVAESIVSKSKKGSKEE